MKKVYASVVETHVLALQSTKLPTQIKVAAGYSVSIKALKARGLGLEGLARHTGLSSKILAGRFIVRKLLT